MHRHLKDLLTDYAPFDSSEAASLRQLSQFLDMSDNPYDRSNLVAHTVCDAWVVSPDREQVLLLVHGASKVWTAPGGHADGSSDILGEAWRELHEETGIAPEQTRLLLKGGLFDISSGAVCEREKPHGLEPAHLHVDICFAFEVDPEKVTLQISNESLDLAWHPVHNILDLLMPCHRRRAVKTLQGVLS